MLSDEVADTLSSTTDSRQPGTRHALSASLASRAAATEPEESSDGSLARTIRLYRLNRWRRSPAARRPWARPHRGEGAEGLDPSTIASDSAKRDRHPQARTESSRSRRGRLDGQACHAPIGAQGKRYKTAGFDRRAPRTPPSLRGGCVGSAAPHLAADRPLRARHSLDVLNPECARPRSTAISVQPQRLYSAGSQRSHGRGAVRQNRCRTVFGRPLAVARAGRSRRATG